jgi:hypothetical protein
MDDSLAKAVWCNSYSLNNYHFRFNPYFKKGTYDEFNALAKLKKNKIENLSISKYDKKVDLSYHHLLTNSADSYFPENSIVEKTKLDEDSINIKFSGSVKELLSRLAHYTGQILSTLFRVLRNTRIHSLSIFFGLCCSRSGYIFEAITGTSSYPVPASL